MTMWTQRFGLLFNGLLFWSLVLSPRSSLQVLVPVLLPTDSGTAETDKEGVTPAPASGHDEDNTLAYTGTVTAASSVHVSRPSVIISFFTSNFNEEQTRVCFSLELANRENIHS